MRKITVEEFQKKYKTKAEKEEALRNMTTEEIMYLARTCGNTTGAAWYARHAQEREHK